MSTATQAIAAVCHDANRAWQIATGDPQPSPPWDQASAAQRASSIDGVRHALNGASPAQLHQAWSDAKRVDGWTHGAVKDTDARTHPCLVPYDELPENQRRKDALFAAIVAALAPQAGPVQEQRAPYLGADVHYTSYGTPGGEYGKECRTATVTELTSGGAKVGLVIFNPEGIILKRGLPYDAGAEQPGDPDCPRAGSHANPFRYCACGWREAAPAGGTWHWPEQT